MAPLFCRSREKALWMLPEDSTFRGATVRAAFFTNVKPIELVGWRLCCGIYEGLPNAYGRYCTWLVMGTPFLTRKDATTLTGVLPLLMPS